MLSTSLVCRSAISVHWQVDTAKLIYLRISPQSTAAVCLYLPSSGATCDATGSIQCEYQFSNVINHNDVGLVAYLGNGHVTNITSYVLSCKSR